MISDEIRLNEVNRARERRNDEVRVYQRVVLVRAITLSLIALLVYAQWSRVIALDRALGALGERTRAELAATGLSFVMAHRQESGSSLDVDAVGRNLLAVAEASSRVRGTTASLAAYGGLSVGRILADARIRPAGINVSLPYLGAVQLPIGYAALALMTGVIAVLANVFTILRSARIGVVEDYARGHAAALGSASDTPAVDAGLGLGDAEWSPVFMGKISGRLIFEVLSGILATQVRQRRPTLVEIGSGVAGIVAVAGLFFMGSYFIIEETLPGEAVTLTLCLAGIAALALGVGISAGTAWLARWQFGRQPALSGRANQGKA